MSETIMHHQPPTEAQLQEWERVCAEATIEPWKAGGKVGDFATLKIDARNVFGYLHGEDEDHIDQQFLDNLNFIASARTALPAVLAELRRCYAAMGELDNECVGVRESLHRANARIAELEGLCREGAEELDTLADSMAVAGWHKSIYESANDCAARLRAAAGE